MPKLGPEPYLHPNVVAKDSTFGQFVEIGEGTRVLESSFDDYSYTDRYSDIAYAKIGKFANIAAFTRINPSEHPHTRASMHHFMYRSHYYWSDEADEAELFAWRRSRPVVLGHDTWIGQGAIVMKGVTIGNGAVVASQAVVTKDVPPYAIVGGVAASFIKWRHPQKLAEKLEALAWWDWSHDQIRLALPDFRSLRAEIFVEKYLRV
ncbi:MAG: chloramphenicol acetyltransferase [Pseudomonadota bacterium]|nr:chloramphenicol acetyltransferase [Pseudomonadota bacterium]